MWYALPIKLFQTSSEMQIFSCPIDMNASHCWLQVEEENMSDGAREQLQQAAAIVTAAEQDTEKAQSAAHQESHSKGLRHLQASCWSSFVMV